MRLPHWPRFPTTPRTSARRLDTPDRTKGEDHEAHIDTRPPAVAVRHPGAGLLWYLFANVRGELLKIGEGNRIAAVGDVAVAASALVHELQKERGLSAGFIGSKGEKFKEALLKQRADSDARRKVMLDSFAARADDLPPGFVERMRKANDAIAALEGKRGEISALKLAGPDSFGFYSASIENYLVAVGSIAPSLGEAGMMRKFSAYVMFLAPRNRQGANARR
jgi:methyl-accepting chemotaxis protein